MAQIVLAVPLDDPSNGGIGQFEHLLESFDRDRLLAQHFRFLELPIVDIVSFGADYEIRFKNPVLDVTVHNDDKGCEELNTTSFETVYFTARSASEAELRAFQKRLSRQLRTFVVAHS